MTPKEKAKELVDKFYNYTPEFEMPDAAKQCALIAVEEILLEGATQYGKTAVDYGREKFWQEVEEEINKL